MVNEASHFSDLPEILNFIPNKVEVIRFDTRASKGRAINSLNISYRQDRPRLDANEARTEQVSTRRSHSRHDAVMRQIELITSREYLLYAMFDDNRSNEELTSGGGISMITTLRNYTNCAAFQRNFAVRGI